MELFIGGFGENKQEFVKTLNPGGNLYEKFDAGSICESLNGDKQPGCIIINNLHLAIKKMLSEEKTTEQIWEDIQFLATQAETYKTKLIFICDEIGNGIVPMDGFERKWREETGRILCKIAERAEKVTRLVAGLPQVIKA